MNQIHRAALMLISAQSFQAMLEALSEDLPAILSADGLHLCIEGAQASGGEQLGPDGKAKSVLIGLPEGGVAAYFGARASRHDKKVVLREITGDPAMVYGDQASDMQSEAVLRVDLGADKRPAMLVIGSKEPHRFHPEQATDLLEFLGGVLDATLRRWLTE